MQIKNFFKKSKTSSKIVKPIEKWFHWKVAKWPFLHFLQKYNYFAAFNAGRRGDWEGDEWDRAHPPANIWQEEEEEEEEAIVSYRLSSVNVLYKWRGKVLPPQSGEGTRMGNGGFSLSKKCLSASEEVKREKEMEREREGRGERERVKEKMRKREREREEIEIESEGR